MAGAGTGARSADGGRICSVAIGSSDFIGGSCCCFADSGGYSGLGYAAGSAGRAL